MQNWFTVLATTAASVSLYAIPASAETLEEAVLTAFEGNPSVESERAFTRVADEQVTQAKALYGPNLDLTVRHQYTYTNSIVPGFSADQDGFGTNAQIELSQPLFTFGRLASNLDLAEASRLRQREGLRAVSQDLILEVISSYVSLRRDLELYTVASDTYDLLLGQRDLTQSRLDLRDATAPDVSQTQNRLELAAGRVIQSRANVEASAARYRNVVGHYPTTLAPLPALPPLESLERLYETLEQYNPDLRSAQFTELASRAQLAAARSAMGPRVDASMVAGRSPLSPYANSTYAEQVVVGVTLNMPIYTGGSLTSQVREAQGRNSAAQNFVEQARRDAREALTSDWNQLRASELSLPRYAAAVRAAEQSVSGVQQQQTAGIRTLRDVLDVTNDLFSARTAAVQAETDRYIAHASVLRDIGLLTADIFAAGAGYDPDSYAPGGAGQAGLPLRVVLDPIDQLLVFDGVRDAEVQIEDDAEYVPGEQLPDPLTPVSQ